MSRLKVFLVILFAAILIPRLYTLIGKLDIGETVMNHSPGPCEIVTGAVNGSEDMEILPGTDIALISNGLLYEKMNSYPERKGNILYFDFSKPKDGFQPVIFKDYPKPLEEFNPHGISVWTTYGKIFEKVEDCKDFDERCPGWSKSGECESNPVYMRLNCRYSCKACGDTEPKKYFLLVVNHEKLFTSVERFQFDVGKKMLTYIETIVDPIGFRVLNDLTATGERTFYFTNYMHYVPGTFMAKIENWAQLRFSNIAYYDGEKTMVLDGSLLMANGVSKSPDSRFLYVNNGGDREIRVYEIQSNNSLNLVQTKEVDTHLDNVNVDPSTGHLWLGCHPVGWKVIRRSLHNPDYPAPSQVIQIKVENGLLTDDIREVYVDSGSVLSGSSSALFHKDSLLVGTVAHKAVFCKGDMERYGGATYFYDPQDVGTKGYIK